MRRAFTAATSDVRCKADITLRDGSGAQCMRKAFNAGLCRQHFRLVCICGHSPSQHQYSWDRDSQTNTRIDCTVCSCIHYTSREQNAHSIVKGYGPLKVVH